MDLDLQRSYLQRYRLLLQDPKVRTDSRKSSREDLNASIANIMNPKGPNDRSSSALLMPEHYPQGEVLKREMDQAVNRVEEFYRRTRAIEDLTIALRGRVYQNTHRLSSDEQKLESLVLELNEKFKDVDRLFDTFEGIKRRATESYGIKHQSLHENRVIMGSPLQSQREYESKPRVSEDHSLINKLKRDLEDEKRKCAVLTKENELLMNDHMRMTGRQSTKEKGGNEEHSAIKKQLDTIIGRIGDLEKVNTKLQEREKEAITECKKLEYKFKAAEDAKKLAEEKELALIRENGRLKERIEAIEIENRKLKEEIVNTRRSLAEAENRQTKEPDSIAAYEVKKRLMEENERLINIISELRREKTALELKKNLDDSVDEQRPRLITFGQPVTTDSLKETETPTNVLDREEQARRSLRAQRLLNLSAAPSSMNKTNERIEDTSGILRQLSRESYIEDQNVTRGKISPTAGPRKSADNNMPPNQYYSILDPSLKQSLLGEPAPKNNVRLSEQRSVPVFNSPVQKYEHIRSGSDIEMKPYIDVKELVARKSGENSPLSSVKTFELKERR